MLFETAIGDAYGVGFEFASRDFVFEHNQLTHYYPHQRYKSLYEKYPDDTQMSLAIAELIIEGLEWEDEIIANKFLEVFRRDKREGYSSRMFKLLNTADNGKEFILQIDANSDGNGAAMRAGPIGFYRDCQEVVEKAAIQARLTHNSNNGIKAAALMTHYFLYERETKAKLGKYIDSKIADNWDEDWTKPVAAKGIESVRAAITAIKRNNSMKELLKHCINFTGDVDTVAAIALGDGLIDCADPDAPCYVAPYEVEVTQPLSANTPASGAIYIHPSDTKTYKFSIDSGYTKYDLPVFEQLEPGDYHVTVYTNTCPQEYENNPVTLRLPPPGGSAGEDKTTCPGSTCTTIGAENQNPDYCYSWEPAEGLDEDQRYSSNPCVHPTRTTTYQLHVIDENDDLIENDEVTVTVKRAPVAEIVATETIICPGVTSLLGVNPSGVNTFLWSTGATTNKIAVQEPGTHSVTITNINHCQATASIEIVDGAMPPIQIIAATPTVCQDQEGGLKEKGAQEKSLNDFCPTSTYLEVDVDLSNFTYQWSNGETTSDIAVSEPNFYAVTATNEYGCSATAQLEIEACADCKKVKDYRFKLLGQEFKSGEIAYLCPDMLMPDGIQIEIIQKQGNATISNFNWSGATFSDPSLQVTKITMLSSPQGGKIICTFKENGTELMPPMELEIKTNVDATVRDKSGDKYAYDAFECTGCERYDHYQRKNDNDNPPNFAIPWKFVAVGKDAKVQVKEKPANAFYAVELETSDPKLTVDPTKLPAKGWNDITLQASAPFNQADITVCNHDPILRVFAATEKTVEIEFFLICESDDDVELIASCDPATNPNCAVQASTETICLDPGVDGTFDRQKGFSCCTDVWGKGDDVLKIVNDKWAVVAGPNKICETPVPKNNNPDCPSNVSENQLKKIVENMNTIFNKVGINISGGSYSLTKLNINYNIMENDNSILEYKEQKEIHENSIIQTSILQGKTPIYIVKDLGNDTDGSIIAGKAEDFNANSLALDRNEIGNLFVPAHELGHAKYGLFHQDMPQQLNPYIPPIKDEMNLMYSFPTNSILRVYQWVLIHKK